MIFNILKIRMVWIIPDGNCLYRCLAWFVYDSQHHWYQIRSELADYVKSHLDQVIQGETIRDWILMQEENHTDVNSYLTWLTAYGTFGGYFELLLASMIFHLHIEIYIRGKLVNNIVQEVSDPIMKLDYINGDHYTIIEN